MLQVRYGLTDGSWLWGWTASSSVPAAHNIGAVGITDGCR